MQFDLPHRKLKGVKLCYIYTTLLYKTKPRDIAIFCNLYTKQDMLRLGRRTLVTHNLPCVMDMYCTCVLY